MPRRDGEVQRVRRPDGSVLQVELYGPPDGPTIVLTHGWGANSTEWYYLKKHLGRAVPPDRLGPARAWASPASPTNNDYSLEKLAARPRCRPRPRRRPARRPGRAQHRRDDPADVLPRCSPRPWAAGRRTGPGRTRPTRTRFGRPRSGALHGDREAGARPLLHLTIALWPLVWLMNWLSYLNGSAHRSMHRDSFAGTETPGQLDFATRFVPQPPRHPRPRDVRHAPLRRHRGTSLDRRPDAGRGRGPRHDDHPGGRACGSTGSCPGASV